MMKACKSSGAISEGLKYLAGRAMNRSGGPRSRGASEISVATHSLAGRMKNPRVGRFQPAFIVGGHVCARFDR